MKVRGYIIALAVAGIGLISCSKEAGLSADGTRVAYIGLAADADGTKSSIDSLSVSWTASDDILYYTGRYTSGSSTAKTGEGSYKVPAACGSLRLPVEYNNGDNRVTVLTKGRAVGAVTPASLNSLTIVGAVPASQDGTFSSTYIAACEGNLLELTALTSGEPKNLTMTPVQAFVRFKLSSLTVGGQTVNKITVAGKVGGSAAPVCGDLSVSITENGSATHTVSSAAGSNTGNLITIDKSGSKFNTGEYIYVALLPQQYDELTLTLYNGGTTLATVPVKQGSEASSTVINASGGRMVDLSVADAINDHAKIKFVSAKMFPEKVAITKDHTTKKLWLKVEPSDFSGTISWSSDKTDVATVESTGMLVDEPGIGKCIEVTVSNKCSGLAYTDKREVTISAKIHSPEDGSLIATKTCVISIGEWVDLGLKTSDGKRCLWARQCVKLKSGTWSLIDNPIGSDDSGSDRLYEHFGWGEITPALEMANDNSRTLTFAWGSSGIGSTGEYEKYNKTNRYPYLQRKQEEFTVTDSKYNTVDDPCTLWGVAKGYTTANNPVVHAPMILDCAELINNIKVDDLKCTSTVVGYTDVFINDIPFAFCSATSTGRYGSADVGGFWTAEYCIDSPVRAIVCRPYAREITYSDRYRRGHFRPVMYTE